jgi:hypothetical protein
MKKPLVSVIVVNYNGKKLLKIILESLKKSAFKNYETIIVDNSSTDGSQEFIKKNYKKAALVENKENLGYSGINSGLKYCRGKYILFLNNDMEIDKDCISQLVKTIESDKKIAMVAPKLVNYHNKALKSGGTWISRAFYSGHIPENKKNIVKEISYLGVGLVRKDFVDMFGYLFDPDYFIYAEDLDMGLRIRLSGKKIVFNPNAILYHMHAVTTQKTNGTFTTFLMERNSLITYFKILSLKNIAFYFPYVLAIRFFAILRDLASFKFLNVYARLRSLFWIIFNLNVVIKKRKETQKFRKVNDEYITRIFSEKYLFKKPFII